MLNIFHYCADMVGLHILKWKKRVEIIPLLYYTRTDKSGQPT